MVRILVATVVQIAARPVDGARCSSDEDQQVAIEPDAEPDSHDDLLQLLLSQDRARTGRMAAPAVGLCFAGVGYDHVPAI